MNAAYQDDHFGIELGLGLVVDIVDQRGHHDLVDRFLLFAGFRGGDRRRAGCGVEGFGARFFGGGVITEDKGLDKNGKPKANFTPGYELRAKVTVLAEGTRGSLTKKLVEKKKLDNINPQSYGIGIKELWDVQPGRIEAGYVAHTLGWPVSTEMYGGGWIYGLSNNRLSIGLVLALEYADPQFDPHAAFQTWKTHPFVKKILEGRKLVRYGAKSLPYGGWYGIPRTYVDGGLIIGDSGSFLDSQRLKGIHMAMKSGMLAAETIFDALKAGDTSALSLSSQRPAWLLPRHAERRLIAASDSQKSCIQYPFCFS